MVVSAPRTDSYYGLMKAELDGMPVVVSQWTAATPGPAEDIAEAEHVAEPAEDVLEAREDGRVESRAAGRGDAEAGVAEAIVQMPLVGVGEDRVRFRRLLEPVLGLFVTGIPVRVVLQSQLAVRALDFSVARGADHPEHFVVIALGHDAFATFTIAGRSRRSPSM